MTAINPAILVLLVAFAAPLVVTLVGIRRADRVPGAAIVMTTLAFAAVLWSFTRDDASFGVAWASTWDMRFTIALDGLAREYALLATGIGLAVVIFSARYLPLHLHHHHRSERELPRFFGFLLLFMAAMVGLVMAQDLILLFVFWDLTAIASFYLIGYDRDEADSRGAAMMAMLVTGISAIFVLIGAVMLWHESGTYDLRTIIATGSDTAPIGWAAALIAAGALAKSAQVPFHFWLPRAMSAPTPVSAYLHSAAMVAAGVFLIGRIYPIVALFGPLRDALLAIGFLSMAVGGVLALTRDAFKQVLAYSTISQYGYVVAMYGLGGVRGVEGAAFYVIAHAIAKSGLFLVAGAITEATGTRSLSEIGGLARRMPLLAVASGLASASMIGLPLTTGFFKDELFFGAGHDRGMAFAILTVAGAALTFTYIARFWGAIFLGEQRATVVAIPGMMIWPIVALGAISVLGGLWTTPMDAIAGDAAGVMARRHVELHLAYHLDPGVEHAMALATWLLGILLIGSRSLWAPAAFRFARWGERIGPEQCYRTTLTGLESLSNAIHRLEVRDLRTRVVTILYPAGVLIGLATLITPNDGAFVIGPFGRGDLPLAAMVIASAASGLAVTVPRDHLRLAVTLSCVGFSQAAIFAFMGAPDVALVAVLVETIFALIFLGMLLLMPRKILRYESRPRRQRGRHTRRDIAIATVSGAMAFLLAWGALSKPATSTELIDTQAALTPLAHGKAIVTVVLADFRGFDTMGEITVIAITLLGILSLIRSGRLR